MSSKAKKSTSNKKEKPYFPALPLSLRRGTKEEREWTKAVQLLMDNGVNVTDSWTVSAVLEQSKALRVTQSRAKKCDERQQAVQDFLLTTPKWLMNHLKRQCRPSDVLVRIASVPLPLSGSFVVYAYYEQQYALERPSEEFGQPLVIYHCTDEFVRAVEIVCGDSPKKRGNLTECRQYLRSKTNEQLWQARELLLKHQGVKDLNNRDVVSTCVVERTDIVAL